MLEQGLYSDEAIVREGVTIGLTEVMSIAGRGQLSEFMNKVPPASSTFCLGFLFCPVEISRFWNLFLIGNLVPTTPECEHFLPPPSAFEFWD